ncbi:alpha/beta fold hydrolase [Micromonospora sp. NPDC023644]|uniref:alpha/beta fold hydrolase n=1 Tax=Micromonospora sp. NPDC023644 TaxID=3154321 RepID=UPI003410FA9A
MAEPSRLAEDPQLLLLHAAGLGRASWDAVVERIPGFARTLAIDLPGHGGVPGLAYDRDVVPRLAEYVAERIAALGLRRPHVVGHSLGGVIALELARRVPVAAVTALCSIGFRAVCHASMCVVRTHAMLRMTAAVGPRTRGRLLSRGVVRRMVMGCVSARPADLRAEVAAADVTSMITSDLSALSRYAGLYSFQADATDTTPVNLVWADQDRVVPLRDALRARRVLPRAQHFVIPGSGHFVVRDDPHGTAAVIHACHAQVLRDRHAENRRGALGNVNPQRGN